MSEASTNPKVQFIEVKDVDHFATLAPINEIIAKKILKDTGEMSTLSISPKEVNQAFSR
ncbi:hypothetical protein ACKFKF_08205 [Phormidesmis sp. 146-12]